MCVGSSHRCCSLEILCVRSAWGSKGVCVCSCTCVCLHVHVVCSHGTTVCARACLFCMCACHVRVVCVSTGHGSQGYLPSGNRSGYGHDVCACVACLHACAVFVCAPILQAHVLMCFHRGLEIVFIEIHTYLFTYYSGGGDQETRGIATCSFSFEA